MTYIRTKKINNNLYCYLVESKHTKQGPRQKVKKYLGRALPLKTTKELEYQPPLKRNKTQLLKALIAWELQKHNFKPKQHLYQNKFLTYNQKNHQILNKKRAVILALNEGHLCPYTINRLLRFKRTNDFEKDAHKLAKYFVEAGIQIPQEVFIEFYQKC